MAGQADGYAVIDLETTGVFNNDRIIEISVVMLDTNFELEAEYDTLVDPRLNYEQSIELAMLIGQKLG